MKNVLSLITYLFFVQSTFGQSRLEMQFSTHFTNARITGNWHQSLGQGLLFSVGVSSGSSARNWIDHSSEEIQDGLRVQSPYTAMNAPVDRNGNQYNLIDYGTKTRFVDLHGGLGYYHEFGAMHGIRANAYFILNYMSNDVSAYYYSMASDSEFGETKVFNHFNAGAGLEVYHTIRLTGRTTFCYGFKVPYYFTLDKARFNPQNPKDSFYGFEPELSVGITYLIGNCPEKGPQ
jgi:hypothetical protein